MRDRVYVLPTEWCLFAVESMSNRASSATGRGSFKRTGIESAEPDTGAVAVRKSRRRAALTGESI